MIKLIQKILDIPSPTFKEQELVKFFKDWCNENLQDCKIDEWKDSLIIRFPFVSGKEHLSFVGHSDVVPEYFKSYIEGDKLYGAGASDMLCSLGIYLYLLKNHQKEILDKYNISIIIYSREEGTSIEENGLFDLINYNKDFFKTIDLAIVGEPTNNTLQIGCVGSLHMKVKIKGLECHSARPWDGENALYKALPLIEKIANFPDKKENIFGVDFVNVINITQSESSKGRTTIPGIWEANINYRFSPNLELEEAEKIVIDLVESTNIKGLDYLITDRSYAGKVIENASFKKFVKKSSFPLEAKQAWTDVAQLTNLGISALNFGAGLTAQAHKNNEYILLADIEEHFSLLKKILLS